MTPRKYDGNWRSYVVNEFGKSSYYRIEGSRYCLMDDNVRPAKGFWWEYPEALWNYIIRKIEEGVYYRCDDKGVRIPNNQLWLFQEKYQGMWRAEWFAQGSYYSVKDGVFSYYCSAQKRILTTLFDDGSFCKQRIDSGEAYPCTSTGEKIVNPELVKYAGKWTRQVEVESCSLNFYLVTETGQLEFWHDRGTKKMDGLLRTAKSFIDDVKNGDIFRWVAPVTPPLICTNCYTFTGSPHHVSFTSGGGGGAGNNSYPTHHIFDAKIAALRDQLKNLSNQVEEQHKQLGIQQVAIDGWKDRCNKDADTISRQYHELTQQAATIAKMAVRWNERTRKINEALEILL
jgi:hypothetical protein